MTLLSAFVMNTVPPIFITLSYLRNLRIWIKRNVEISKYLYIIQGCTVHSDIRGLSQK